MRCHFTFILAQVKSLDNANNEKDVERGSSAVWLLKEPKQCEHFGEGFGNKIKVKKCATCNSTARSIKRVAHMCVGTEIEDHSLQHCWS